MTSVEAYIPYDLRERLASQIEIIDKMMLDAVAAERAKQMGVDEAMARFNEALTSRRVREAVAAERERCAKIAETLSIEQLRSERDEEIARLQDLNIGHRREIERLRVALAAMCDLHGRLREFFSQFPGYEIQPISDYETTAWGDGHRIDMTIKVTAIRKGE